MRNNRFTSHLFLMIVGLIAAIAVQAPAEEGKVDENSRKSTTVNKSQNPHCGLFCIYTVMKMAGKEVDFRDLVKPEYLGSKKGSSLAELKKASNDYGLNAEPATRMTALVLEKSPYPVILHVKSSLESREYDHFELFLGTENGRAKIYNPPEPVKLLPACSNLRG